MLMSNHLIGFGALTLTLTGYTADQIPTMTAASSPSGTASAGSTLGGFDPYKAMDDNPTGASNVWLSNGVTSTWLQYQFSSPKRIERYTVTACKNATQDAQAPGDAPKDFTFEAWNGSTWVVLDTRTGQAFADTNEKKTYDITGNTNSYTDYRLNVTAVTSGSRIGVAEMEMMEGVYS